MGVTTRFLKLYWLFSNFKASFWCSRKFLHYPFSSKLNVCMFSLSMLGYPVSYLTFDENIFPFIIVDSNKIKE